MFGGGKDPMVVQQEKGNTLLTGIKAGIDKLAGTGAMGKMAAGAIQGSQWFKGLEGIAKLLPKEAVDNAAGALPSMMNASQGVGDMMKAVSGKMKGILSWMGVDMEAGQGAGQGPQAPQARDFDAEIAAAEAQQEQGGREAQVAELEQALAEAKEAVAKQRTSMAGSVVKESKDPEGHAQKLRESGVGEEKIKEVLEQTSRAGPKIEKRFEEERQTVENLEKQLDALIAEKEASRTTQGPQAPPAIKSQPTPMPPIGPGARRGPQVPPARDFDAEIAAAESAAAIAGMAWETNRSNELFKKLDQLKREKEEASRTTQGPHAPPAIKSSLMAALLGDSPIGRLLKEGGVMTGKNPREEARRPTTEEFNKEQKRIFDQEIKILMQISDNTKEAADKELAGTTA
jgi:uncharacterized coiled-coil protein SlyX